MTDEEAHHALTDLESVVLRLDLWATLGDALDAYESDGSSRSIILVERVTAVCERCELHHWTTMLDRYHAAPVPLAISIGDVRPAMERIRFGRPWN